MLGERGITLSGGGKAACVPFAKLLQNHLKILDSGHCLSASDTKTENVDPISF